MTFVIAGHRVRTAAELALQRVAVSGNQVGYRQKVNGVWRAYSWRELGELAREIAAGLIASGVSLGDRVALMGHASFEMVAADVGIQLAGAITVPLYASHTKETCAHIFRHAEPRVAIVEEVKLLRRLLSDEVQPAMTSVTRVICLKDRRATEREDAVQPLSALVTEGRVQLGRRRGCVEDRANQLRPDDAFRISYTSGTTGMSKGVVQTHANILAQCRAMAHAVPLGAHDEHVMFAPTARTLGMVLEWLGIAVGYRTAFASGGESPAALLPEFAEIQPTFVGAGTPFYQGVYQIFAQAAEEAGPDEAARFRDALVVARELARDRLEGRPISPNLARAFQRVHAATLGRVAAALGGRLRNGVSGGIPLPADLAAFFEATGCTIFEGYGMTEATGFTHVNRPGRLRFGTAGHVLPDTEAKLEPDGELLMRGPTIMKEYYRNPDATEQAIGADGWYRTGDLCEVDSDGYLKFIDRRSNLVVLGDGIAIPPQSIEAPLRLQPAMKEVVVVGEGRPHAVALVTLRDDYLRQWAAKHNVTGWQTYAELVARPEVRALVQAMFDQVNLTVPERHRVKAFAILPRDFSAEAGEMTQTLKPKRDGIANIHARLIDELYAEPRPIPIPAPPRIETRLQEKA
ncbi:MAG TPA: AMP-binding protein [Kofleriaceae bacterium]|nr:AMP-binding protein [Kofleriaceae bacterium]